MVVGAGPIVGGTAVRSAAGDPGAGLVPGSRGRAVHRGDGQVAQAHRSGLLALALVGITVGALSALPQLQGQVVVGTASSVVPDPLQPPGTPLDPTSYAFGGTTPQGVPFTWDRCTAIPVVINPAGAAAGAVQDVLSAIDDIGRVSGLRFAYVGTTQARPDPAWGQQQQPGHPGWPPVLVAWAPATSGLIDGSSAGTAHTFSVGSSYVSGMVVLNVDQERDRPGGLVGGIDRRAVLQHEIAHIAGLAHVEDAGQLMHPDAAAGPVLGAGDRAGLRILGEQPCVPAPLPPW